MEQMNEYLFIVLKPIDMDEEFCLNITDLDFFIGEDWIITVQEERCAAVSDALNKVPRLRHGFVRMRCFIASWMRLWTPISL